jgi:methionyl aminopeptidase
MISIKTKEDIAILREGGHRHAAILRELAAMVRPGVTAAELNARAEELIREGGDQAAFLHYQPEGATRPYPASLCVSVNDEVGIAHKGMITDAAITVAVGNIDKKAAKLLEDTRAALMAGIREAKGGRRVGDISNAIERVGVAGGYGIVEELSGHGVGYHVHEDPFVPNYGEAGKGEVLKPGMVIAIEPMFNLGARDIFLDEFDGYTYKTEDGKPSAHFEHTVLITKGDAEILTA